MPCRLFPALIVFNYAHQKVRLAGSAGGECGSASERLRVFRASRRCSRLTKIHPPLYGVLELYPGVASKLFPGTLGLHYDFCIEIAKVGQ